MNRFNRMTGRVSVQAADDPSVIFEHRLVGLLAASTLILLVSGSYLLTEVVELQETLAQHCSLPVTVHERIMSWREEPDGKVLCQRIVMTDAIITK